MKRKKPGEHFHFPFIGQRITKTTIAVFLCLLYYSLRGYRGQDMPTEAAITAIICLQPYMRDTKDFAISRFAGSLMGAVWGLLFLLLLLIFPQLGENLLLLYILMALGVLVSLYTAVLFRRPDASSLAAIVFICVVIAFPEIENPLGQAADRMLGILVGTTAAIVVNVFRLPRRKNRDYVFFVRTKDLAPDRFSQIPAAALFRLNYLYNDGAKICLMSEHAPAFFALQMNQAQFSIPLIVMDGAAIYDVNENEILYAETIHPDASTRLRKALDEMGLSYIIYTAHKGKICIFHHGKVGPEEQLMLDRMRRSPYRSYLEGEIYEQREIVYFKLIAGEGQLAPVEAQLRERLRGLGLRSVLRKEAGADGIESLYIYSDKATMGHAEARVMKMLREKEPQLRAVEVFLPQGYHSEHDAMLLLHKLGNFYEPVSLPFFKKKKKED